MTHFFTYSILILLDFKRNRSVICIHIILKYTHVRRESAVMLLLLKLIFLCSSTKYQDAGTRVVLLLLLLQRQQQQLLLLLQPPPPPLLLLVVFYTIFKFIIYNIVCGCRVRLGWQYWFYGARPGCNDLPRWQI